MFVTDYLEWHYLKIPSKLFEAFWKSLVYFFYYFSIPLLFKTFFAPWKRVVAKKIGPSFNPKEIFEVLVFNLISRTIGTLVRITIIFTWLIFQSTLLPFQIIALFFWMLLPFFTLPLYLLFRERKDLATKIIKKTGGEPQKILAMLAETQIGEFIFGRLLISSKDLARLSAGAPRISAKDSRQLIASLSENYPPFTKLLSEKNLEKSDLLNVYDWFETRKAFQRQPLGFWQEKTTPKVPQIGRDLVFGYTPNLDQYTRDLTGKLPFAHHLVGRQKETRLMEQILARSTDNSLLLVGEPGVGRHTIVENLGQRIREGKTNPVLFGKRLLSFNLSQIVAAGKNFLQAKGIAEQALKEAVDAGNLILVIDNFDQFASVGEGRVDLTPIFVKALSEGLQIIGITTPDSLAKYLQPNQEIIKELEKVEALPATGEEALEILEDIVPFYERKNKVFIPYQTLKTIVEKADQYVTHIPFPEKAIDLLDELCVCVSSQKKSLVAPADVDLILSQKAEIPLGELTKEEKDKLARLEEVIHQRIINQEEAVTAIAKAMRRARVGIAKTNRPIGSFLFLGPTGVGKTETAKALAEGYFGDEERMIRFDMSEYQGEEAIERVIGSVDKQEPGLFAKAIRDNPFSLLLLDEIEKTDPKILNLFLVLLDEGFFTDAFGKKVDCRNLIIIGTSNAGTELIREKLEQGICGEKLEKQVIDYVQRERIFSPEFLNRFDAVVIFNPLTKDNLRQIARLMLEKLDKRLADKKISLKITDQLIEKIVEEGFDPAFGARPMNRVIQDKLEDKIAKKLLKGEVKKGEEIEINL